MILLQVSVVLPRCQRHQLRILRNCFRHLEYLKKKLEDLGKVVQKYIEGEKHGFPRICRFASMSSTSASDAVHSVAASTRLEKNESKSKKRYKNMPMDSRISKSTRPATAEQKSYCHLFGCGHHFPLLF